jgi:hypothetical protein
MLNTLFRGPYDAYLMVHMNHKPTKILEGKFRGKNMLTLLKNLQTVRYRRILHIILQE